MRDPPSRRSGTSLVFYGAPWQKGKAPIIRFVTDDHKVIGVMFGPITRTFEDRVSQYLMVSSPAGVVVIRGPGVNRDGMGRTA
jgi:hypothetical protein